MTSAVVLVVVGGLTEQGCNQRCALG